MSAMTILGGLMLLANGYLLLWGGAHAIEYAGNHLTMTSKEVLTTRRMGQCLRVVGWLALVVGASLLMPVA